MTYNELMPILIICASLVPGLVIFFIPDAYKRLRLAVNSASIALNLAFVFELVRGVLAGESFATKIELLPGVSLSLRADPMSLLFLCLSAALWLLTTIYALGYLRDSAHQSRFFGFFSICVGCTSGIALAGNLLTMLYFYELLTLSTWPLVVHRGTDKAIRGGRIYLIYTLLGSAALVVGAIWLRTLVGPVSFEPGGLLADLPAMARASQVGIFVLLILGFGVKAAMFPLHGWLPQAMVAPAPVSALLHAVAVVKAGAFGITRIIYEVYGIDYCQDAGLLVPIAVLASITILYGSTRAIYQDDLKRRLAFSTVSQVSYIALGIAVFGPLGSLGGLVHLVHQGIMKITLFFCAGNLAETKGIHKVSEMAGVGRKMPWTMGAFSVAALGMIGIPPLAGFVSKWYLGSGAIAAGMYWVIAVLIASATLNAMYFLPILYTAWFGKNEAAQPHHAHAAGGHGPADDHAHLTPGEAPIALLIPPLVTALAVILAGVFANSPWSPLTLVRIIVTQEYGP